jgi:hypothetical protein
MMLMVQVRASKASEAGEMPSAEMFEAMGKFNEELAKSGELLGANGMHASSKGTRIVWESGVQKIVEGPFPVEEVVSGYWLVQVPSKEALMELFKRCPPTGLHGDGAIEIRKIFEAEDFGDALPESEKAREEEMRVQIEKNAG